MVSSSKFLGLALPSGEGSFNYGGAHTHRIWYMLNIRRVYTVCIASRGIGIVNGGL